MTEQHTPVLIVGGSVVGLSAALFLARHGVDCMLVERHPSTSIHPRAVGYYPRTIELLAQAGVAEAVEQDAVIFATHRTRAGIESLAGKELFAQEELENEDALGDLTPRRMVLLPQDRLEPHLRRRAEELGADLRFGVRLDSYEQDADGVTAVIADTTTHETTTVRADWLIGADGPRSTVREALGIARTGLGVMSHHVSIAFGADLAGVLRGRRFSVVHVQNETTFGILVHDDTLTCGTFIVGYDPAQETWRDFDEERCRALVSSAIGDPSVEVTIRSVFPWDMAELVAERFVDGRVLLAGDAAHVVPPTGGYGANTGIADAHNLAWKLALVVNGQAGRGLVDSYGAEREPTARYVARQGALTLAVRSKRATEAEKAEIADPVTVTTGYRYRSTAVRAEADIDLTSPAVDPRTLGGQPGGRAPYLPLATGGSTIDLFGAGFVLLAGPDGEDWADAAGKASVELGVPVTSYVVDEPAFAPAYGIGPDGAALVRPDGIVAWRAAARSASAADEFAAAFTAVLDR